MTAILRKKKSKKENTPFSKADRLAIKLGGKRFDATAGRIAGMIDANLKTGS